MITPLIDAVSPTCGAKAATLAMLMRQGIPVPDGFVVHHDHEPLLDAVVGYLAALGSPVVAVRSSASNEDGAESSAAGQYDSFLGVHGNHAVVEAIRACRGSLGSARAASYWNHSSAPDAEMAVLVQRLIDAEAAGVMFTPVHPNESIRIEASWGLGSSVVDGAVTPDTYVIAPNGAITRSIGGKATRTDSRGGKLSTTSVASEEQLIPALSESAAAELGALGIAVANVLGCAQDIEWAVDDDGKMWILQARPITAALPPLRASAFGAERPGLVGTPGSAGIATGTPRILHGPSDFSRVRPGDILVCSFTDPAWTPLFRIAAGVITETGGALSHAAIVAREHGIPAILGVADATSRLRDADSITIDGFTGHIAITSR
ncbi:PEP/pyruvate-binding domain-containing protein [Rhodococcus sovatensis]|uniref:PEP/pyruvate-binding domain-containing protein n=1 Tax=Rhodococcus sovatensis TaxID=1805840 RepID=A0ABZ2PJK4_9NOCA